MTPSLTDQLGRELSFPGVPKRVVSLVPSLTALLCALGLEDHLVGVTKFCDRPSEIRSHKTVVGGTKSVHFDRIRKLQPDLILCNKEENTREMVTGLEAFTQVHVSDIITIEDFFELLDHYGVIFQVNSKTEDLKARIRKAQLTRGHDQDAHRTDVAYFIWRDPWMLAGGNTFINTMLHLGGFNNVAGHLPRYPSFQGAWPESWPKPRCVFLSSEPFPFREKHIQEVELLFPDARVLVVDGTWFSWYDTELPLAIRKITELNEGLF